MTKRDAPESGDRPEFKFTTIEKETKNRRRACMLLGAPAVNVLYDHGLRVIPWEDTLLVYHADELERLGGDLKELRDAAIKTCR